jgi:phosphoglycolate phosphatase-like HAD superfamily hydrolase
MAVATGNFSGSGRFKLRSAGLNPEGVPMASADDGIHRPQLLQTALRRASSGVTIARTLYVGDWTWDIRAAKALDWEFIGIGDEEGEKVLHAEGATRVLRDFRNFLNEL